MENLHKGFASDNVAGVHPQIIEAITKVNTGYYKPYGEDEISTSVDELFKNMFGQEVEVCLTLNGTGANVLAIRSMLQSWQGIICSDIAHINTDETGAPEFCTGSKILSMPSKNGKIYPSDLDKFVNEGATYHRVCPGAVSISQSTEQGTLYSVEEIKAMCDYAKQKNLLVFMDGSRISNACAAMNMDIKSMTKDLGVDVLALGGAKNGLMFGEAIVFFNPELAKHYKRIRKQSLQLISKMRFLSVQFLAYFENELWLKNATQANEMAKYLGSEISKIDGISVQKPEANAVFIRMSKNKISNLMEKYYCYEMDNGDVRLMCNFSTTKEDIDNLVKHLRLC